MCAFSYSINCKEAVLLIAVVTLLQTLSGIILFLAWIKSAHFLIFIFIYTLNNSGHHCSRSLRSTDESINEYLLGKYIHPLYRCGIYHRVSDHGSRFSDPTLHTTANLPPCMHA